MENKEDYIGAMTLAEYLSRPTNMACHDLCLENPTPQGTFSLLGLGLKVCTSRARPTNRTNRTIDRVKEDGVFKENPPKNREGVHYIPQLYIKNTEWVQRLTANKEIEQELDNFELKLRQAWRNHQKRLSISNLTIRQ